MAARTSSRRSVLSLPIDDRASAQFRAFRSRTPLFSVSAGRVLVTLTLPTRLRASDVQFARTLAEQARAYAVEVERLYRSGRGGSGSTRSSSAGSSASRSGAAA